MADIERSYYSIREVSEMLDIPFPTLRYWEHEIEVLKPRKNGGKTRFYSPDDVEMIRKIKYLREQNVPVADVSRRLKLDEKGVDERAKAMQLLQSLREELVALRDML